MERTASGGLPQHALARSIVKFDERGLAAIQLLNFSRQPSTLKAGTIVGHLNPSPWFRTRSASGGPMMNPSGWYNSRIASGASRPAVRLAQQPLTSRHGDRNSTRVRVRMPAATLALTTLGNARRTF